LLKLTCLRAAKVFDEVDSALPRRLAGRIVVDIYRRGFMSIVGGEMLCALFSKSMFVASFVGVEVRASKLHPIENEFTKDADL
jgi:hypothetical protein